MLNLSHFNILREITCSANSKDILISLLSTCETSALDHVTSGETQACYTVGLDSCCLDPLQGSLV